MNRSHIRLHQRGWLLWLVVALLGGCGYQEQTLPTTYGKRTGTDAKSINGTKALSEMFRAAGYHVRSFNSISPRTLQYDVIIWVPDSFEGPSLPLQETILDWLEEDNGRTFVYIGRDFDASISYWNTILSQVDLAQKLDVMRQRSLAIQQFDQYRNTQPAEADYTWFKTKRDVPRRIARNLQGTWASGVDGRQTEIVLRSELIPPHPDQLYQSLEDLGQQGYLLEDQEVLLAAGDEPIVVRLGNEYFENQIILINNGSFLLNLPLVNPEHRKLAAHLIDECDTSYGAQSVAFLETGGYVPIRNADDSTQGTSGWEWLKKWPLNLVGLQMAWWLIVLCFALYPIFGRAKKLPSSSTSDFKKHIDSVGDLLEATDDHGYAQLRLQQYQQVMKGDAVYRRSKTRRVETK